MINLKSSARSEGKIRLNSITHSGFFCTVIRHAKFRKVQQRRKNYSEFRAVSASAAGIAKEVMPAAGQRICKLSRDSVQKSRWELNVS